MTDSDRIVQVFVSLIEDAVAMLREGNPEQQAMMADGLGRVVALLSQPTPIAEPKRLLLTHPHDGHGPNDTCFDCRAADPSTIHDVTPPKGDNAPTA